MKNSLFIFLSFIILCCTAQNASAGFWVKKQSSLPALVVAASSGHNQSVINKESHSTLLSKISHLVPPALYHNPYKKNEWYGIAAIGSGLLGLFIPGLCFAAMLFGLLGMGRGCQQQGLAVAGFVMGILELALYLIVGATALSLILL